MCTEVSRAAFSNSSGMLSGPAALLFFSYLIAFLTSVSVGRSQFMSSSWSKGSNVGEVFGGSLLRSC